MYVFGQVRRNFKRGAVNRLYLGPTLLSFGVRPQNGGSSVPNPDEGTV
jgi:hypothetical protein